MCTLLPKLWAGLKDTENNGEGLFSRDFEFVLTKPVVTPCMTGCNLMVRFIRSFGTLTYLTLPLSGSWILSCSRAFASYSIPIWSQISQTF